MQLSKLNSVLVTAALLFAFTLQVFAQASPGEAYVGPPPVLLNKGTPCVGTASGAGCASSGAWIDVTPFIPSGYAPGTSSDYGVPVNAATTASTNGNAIHAETITGSVYLNTSWITTGGGFSGSLYIGTADWYVNSNTGTQAIPGTAHLYAAGRSAGSAFTANSGSVIAACNSGVTNGTIFTNVCGSTSWAPTKTGDSTNYTALLCLSNEACNLTTSGSPGSGFDAQVWNITVDCSSVANAVGAANYWMQNLSGFYFMNVTGCRNTNEISVDLGGGTGGAQESSVWKLEITDGNVTNCAKAASSVGIRVWTAAGNGSPFSIEDVHIVDSCANGANSNDLIEIANGSLGGIRLSDIHGESAGRCMICIGVYSNFSTGTEVDTGSAAGQVLIQNSDCGPAFGTTGVACVRIASNTNFSGASVGNVNVQNLRQTSTTAPANLIGDDNNTAIAASSFRFVAQYVTLAAGGVFLDSTYTNKSNFGSISLSGQLVSSVATGTAPLTVASTTNVTNLNASSLSGATFAAPGPIGGTTPGTSQFTTLQLSTSFSLLHLVDSHTAVTVSGTGLGTSPTVTASNGTAAFEITTGSSPSAATFTITFPAATTGWAAHCSDITNPTTGGGINIKQTGFTTTTAVMSPYNATPALTALTASDVLVCLARGF